MYGNDLATGVDRERRIVGLITEAETELCIDTSTSMLVLRPQGGGIARGGDHAAELLYGVQARQGVQVGLLRAEDRLAGDRRPRRRASDDKACEDGGEPPHALVKHCGDRRHIASSGDLSDSPSCHRL